MMDLNLTQGFNLLAAAGWKSIIVLASAALATTLLRGRSAAVRHFVWTLAFAALLILPFLSSTLPALYLPSQLADQSTLFSVASSQSPATTPGIARRTASGVAPAVPRRSLPDLRLWLVLLWTAGTLAILIKTAVAFGRLSQVRRNAMLIDDAHAVELARSLGVRRSVEVRQSHDRQMPFAFGLLKPTVLMPSPSTWNDERRQVVLLHELAHVRRGDLQTHLLARIALAFYWWNPIAWFAWHQFLNERERAADDLVLESGTLPSGYAEHLLEIARTMHAAPTTAIAIARPSQLEARLRAILDGNTNRRTPGRAAAWTAGIAAVCVLAPLAALHAQAPTQPTPMPVDVEATIRSAQSQKNPELLDSAAKAAATQMKSAVAKKLLDASLAVRRESFGERSPSYATGLMNLADFNRRSGDYKEAESLYSQAASLLAGQREAAPALIGLGVCAMVAHDSEKAKTFFEQAQAADPEHAGMALTWLAIVQPPTAGDDAEKLYQQALALETAGTAEYASTTELYARYLRRNDRTDEANTLINRARETRRALGFKPDAHSTVKRAGAPGVTRPELLSKVEPQYTEEARLAKYEGTAVVYAEIGADGMAHNMQIISGVGFGLDDQAILAIQQWRFKPATQNGQPVAIQANIEVNWRLL